MKRLAAACAALCVLGPMTAVLSVVSAPAASAETNGVGQTPAMGWSTWSFVRSHPSAAIVEAQANALKSSGLAALGYDYVNLDDFWYVCPGSQGPAVDANGRWVIDPAKFPPDTTTGENGIQVVADYVHSLGLKFGLYVTPGISAQAVAQNSPILGPNGQPSGYTADQIAEPTVSEHNYNCGGMVGINYASPGGQDFINSWADEFASWGVDYLKLDGVGSFDIPDVQAWSQALEQTGRPIHFELSNNLAINDASTWAQYSNGWRTGGDIECYCSGTSYPLTDWNNVFSRFNQVAAWQPDGGPGGFNDYDSIEVGNGANDGLTFTERQTQLSLWALASSPFILGTDLTHLNKTDLGLLKNKAVIAVDQDSIDAARVSDTATSQVFAKKEKAGDAIAGLFNTSGQTEQVTTTASALGLPASAAYRVVNLWKRPGAAGAVTESAGTISLSVPSHGVALLRVTPVSSPGHVPPEVTHSFSGTAPAMTAGQPVTVTESFGNDGAVAIHNVRVVVTAPAGWMVTPTTPDQFPTVASGQSVTASFAVSAPATTAACASSRISAAVVYHAPGFPTAVAADGSTVVSYPSGNTVSPPFQTYSSATDAPAEYGQAGAKFCVTGAGTNLYSGYDDYSTVYRPTAVAPSSEVTTEVASQQGLTGFAKAGIIVRNDMTGSGTTPEGVILYYSPAGGIQLEWDANDTNYIDAVTPSNGALSVGTPVHLMLQRTNAVTSGSSYVGYYSTDGKNWYVVGSAVVPAQTSAQDAGLFVTSGAKGVPGGAVFQGFHVATVSGRTYEAESANNTVTPPAVVAACASCSSGQKVGFVGNGGAVTFNNITVKTAGTYDVTIGYCDGDSRTGRQADMTVDGGTPQLVQFRSSGNWLIPGFLTVAVPLKAGFNTIEFANPSAFAPDFDRLIVPPKPAP